MKQGFEFEAVITEIGDGVITVSVKTVSPEVDRPVGMGWSVRDNPRGQKLVKRLEKAIAAGAVAPSPSVKTDVNGKTYVALGGYVVRGRAMNADLKALGY